MVYICEKPSGSCPKCEHFRWDDDRERMACWALEDLKKITKSAPADDHKN